MLGEVRALAGSQVNLRASAMLAPRFTTAASGRRRDPPRFSPAPHGGRGAEVHARGRDGGASAGRHAGLRGAAGAVPRRRLPAGCAAPAARARRAAAGLREQRPRAAGVRAAQRLRAASVAAAAGAVRGAARAGGVGASCGVGGVRAAGGVGAVRAWRGAGARGDRGNDEPGGAAGPLHRARLRADGEELQGDGEAAADRLADGARGGGGGEGARGGGAAGRGGRRAGKGAGDEPARSGAAGRRRATQGEGAARIQPRLRCPTRSR
jgi:hypothetical protein